MKSLRALLLGVLLWILIFVEISITMIGLKLPETTVWIIHLVLLIPITILCSWLYYKTKDKTNGFVLGIVLLVVGVILDMIITVPFFIVPQGGSYATYFSSVYMWIGFVELIVVTGIYDIVKRKK